MLNDIKRTLLNTRNKIVESANRDLILMYYKIGLKLIENNKWSSSFIDTLAKDLKIEFPTIKGMSARNLRYMQKFASEYNYEILQGRLAKLSWNHNQIGKLNFYLNAVDQYVKNKDDNPTFGILLCKNKKRVTAELALKDIDKPIGVSEYKILSEIPLFLENTLPSIEDIEKRLEQKN